MRHHTVQLHQWKKRVGVESFHPSLACPLQVRADAVRFCAACASAAGGGLVLIVHQHPIGDDSEWTRTAKMLNRLNELEAMLEDHANVTEDTRVRLRELQGAHKMVSEHIIGMQEDQKHQRGLGGGVSADRLAALEQRVLEMEMNDKRSADFKKGDLPVDRLLQVEKTVTSLESRLVAVYSQFDIMRHEIERVVAQSKEDKNTYLISRGQADGNVVLAVGNDTSVARRGSAAPPSGNNGNDGDWRLAVSDIRREMADMKAAHAREIKELHDKYGLLVRTWEDRHGDVQRRAAELSSLVQHGGQAHMHKGHLHLGCDCAEGSTVQQYLVDLWAGKEKHDGKTPRAVVHNHGGGMSESQLKVFLAEWWRDVDLKYRDDLKRDMIVFWKERDNMLRLKMDSHDVKEHVLDRIRDYDATIKRLFDDMKGNFFIEMKNKIDDSVFQEALRGRDAAQKKERDELKAYITREMEARIKMGNTQTPINLSEVERHVVTQIAEQQRERDGAFRQDIDDLKRNLTELTIHGKLVNQTELHMYVQQAIDEIPPHRCSTDSREWRMWFLSSLLSLLHRSIKHKTSLIRDDSKDTNNGNGGNGARAEPISLLFSPDPTSRSLAKKRTASAGSSNGNDESKRMENALRSLKDKKAGQRGGANGELKSPDGSNHSNNSGVDDDESDQMGAEEEEIATKLTDKVTTLGDKFQLLIHEMVCERRCPIPVVTKNVEVLEPPTEPEEPTKSSKPEHAEKKRVLDYLLLHPRLLRLTDSNGRAREPNLDDVDRLLIEGMGGKRTLSCLRVLDETECSYDTIDDLITATDEERMDSENARRRAFTIMHEQDKSLKRSTVDDLFEICDRPGAGGRPAVGGASTLAYLLQLQRGKQLDAFCTWPQDKQVAYIQDHHSRAVVERARVLAYLRDPANNHQFLRAADPSAAAQGQMQANASITPYQTKQMMEQSYALNSTGSYMKGLAKDRRVFNKVDDLQVALGETHQDNVERTQLFLNSNKHALFPVDRATKLPPVHSATDAHRIVDQGGAGLETVATLESLNAQGQKFTTAADLVSPLSDQELARRDMNMLREYMQDPSRKVYGPRAVWTDDELKMLFQCGAGGETLRLIQEMERDGKRAKSLVELTLLLKQALIATEEQKAAAAAQLNGASASLFEGKTEVSKADLDKEWLSIYKESDIKDMQDKGEKFANFAALAKGLRKRYRIVEIVTITTNTTTTETEFKESDIRFEDLPEETRIEATKALHHHVRFQVELEGLEKKMIGQTDAYLEFKRQHGHIWELVGRTRPVENSYEPKFGHQIFSLIHLCNEDHKQKILVQAYDGNLVHAGWAGAVLIGQFSVTLEEILNEPEKKYPVVDPEKRKINKPGYYYTNSGYARFSRAELYYHVSRAVASLPIPGAPGGKSRVFDDKGIDFFLQIQPVAINLPRLTSKGTIAFLEIYSCDTDTTSVAARWKLVYSTEHTRQGENNMIKFAPYTMASSTLCENELDRPIRIQAWHLSNKDPKNFIGMFVTSLRDLLSKPQFQFALTREQAAFVGGGHHRAASTATVPVMAGTMTMRGPVAGTQTTAGPHAAAASGGATAGDAVLLEKVDYSKACVAFQLAHLYLSCADTSTLADRAQTDKAHPLHGVHYVGKAKDSAFLRYICHGQTTRALVRHGDRELTGGALQKKHLEFARQQRAADQEAQKERARQEHDQAILSAKADEFKRSRMAKTMRNKLSFQISGVLESKTLPGPVFLELFRFREADWQLVVTTEMQTKTFLWAPIAIPERLLSSPSHDPPQQSPLLIRVWSKKSFPPGPNGERQPSTAILIGECKCVLADIKNPLPPTSSGINEGPQGLHIVNENELLRNPMNYEHSGLLQFVNVTVTPMNNRGTSNLGDKLGPQPPSSSKGAPASPTSPSAPPTK